MNKSPDCQLFQDQLDRLVADDLPPDGRDQLYRHAAECDECAMILKMNDRLSEKSLADLEFEVPDELAAGMWARVHGGIERREERRIKITGRRWSWGWLIPVQSAAVVLLLVAAGWLAGRLNKLQQREEWLSQRIQKQEQRLSVHDPRAAEEREMQSAGWIPGPRWEKVLSGREVVTVAEVNHMLGTLPPGRQILPAAQAREIIRRISKRSDPAMAKVLKKIRAEDGLDAGESLALLSSFDLDPKTQVTKKVLMGFLKRISGERAL